MSFPALLEASDDPVVRRRRNATVYLYLVKRLDFVEFRRVTRVPDWATKLAMRDIVRAIMVEEGLR